MAMSAEAYRAQLQALLPQGAVWPRESNTVLARFLVALADELARVDAGGESLVDEADPRTAAQLLADWERVTGLPDPCVIAEQSVDQRRAALVARVTMLGGQSRQYFIDLADSLGYPGATVDEYRPMNCNDDCNDALWSAADRFVWQINLPTSGGVFIANCNSNCNSPLAAWGDEAVECLIDRLKPAHTIVIFAYP